MFSIKGHDIYIFVNEEEKKLPGYFCYAISQDNLEQNELTIEINENKYSVKATINLNDESVNIYNNILLLEKMNDELRVMHKLNEEFDEEFSKGNYWTCEEIRERIKILTRKFEKTYFNKVFFNLRIDEENLYVITFK